MCQARLLEPPGSLFRFMLGLPSPRICPILGCLCCWFKDPLEWPAEWAVGFHVVVLQVQASAALPWFSLVCPDSDPSPPEYLS